MKREISEIEAKRVEQHQEMTDDQVVQGFFIWQKLCCCEKAPQVVMACVANMVEILLNIVRILKPREWSNITR